MPMGPLAGLGSWPDRAEGRAGGGDEPQLAGADVADLDADCIAHRPSDLGAQADDGTATAKVAAGLLADSATKIILRQAADQLELVASSFGLTAPETEVVGQLAQGHSLWKIAGHTALVDHLLTPIERAICDTDQKMRAINPGHLGDVAGAG